MARLAVKLCMVVGMLLLIPALWAVAVLIGLKVPMSGGSSMGVSSKGMALLMLVCWPIAVMLVGGAYFYAKQHAKFDASQKSADEVVEPGEGI